MDKRYTQFFLISMIIVMGWMLIQSRITPPPVKPVVERIGDKEEETDAPLSDSEQVAPDGADSNAANSTAASDDPTAGESTDKTSDAAPSGASPPVAIPQQWFSLGSANSASPFQLLATLTNRGAAVECVQLNHPKYVDLEDTSGYLGYLALTNEPAGAGCKVNAVGDGTPAEKAGLQPGDVIVSLAGKAITNRESYRLALGSPSPGDEYQVERGKKPGDEIEIVVLRGGAKEEVSFTATLGKRPMSVMQPEPVNAGREGRPAQLSYLMSLSGVGDAGNKRGVLEIAGLPSLRTSVWEAEAISNGVAFRFHLDKQTLKKIGVIGELEIIKRFTLAPVPDAQERETAYHLNLEIEIRNLGENELPVSYKLDGPTGLPLEGWWYTNKIHPKMFNTAGARDVLFQTLNGPQRFSGCRQIVKDSEDNDEDSSGVTDVFARGAEPSQIDYASVDTQYFAAILLPQNEGAAGQSFEVDKAIALPVSTHAKDDPSRFKTANVTYRLTSFVSAPQGGAVTHHFKLFNGPKDPQVLEKYGLGDYIIYGWFGPVSWLMLKLMHFFGYLGNYGVAIILLTVFVRSCMHPLGRKAAMNAKKMQELSPQMKQIAERYKDDVEKRTKAQQELFQQHGFNPLAGCAPMFLQLPIFLGLYRGLAVDIDLRGAALIPGISWCANLAGPDRLMYWETYLPAILAAPMKGWLGPYLNVLPLCTVALFMVHQKLFTPPPTDEQSQMQQKMMKYMMLFMGLMFFRVPAGLCIYFITSSLWGIAERKLLPTAAPAGKDAASAVSSKTEGGGGGGKGGKGPPTGEKKPGFSLTRLLEKKTNGAENRANRPRRKPKKKR